MRRHDRGTLLDRRTLNRTLLARQSLLARGSASVPDGIELLVGMQAQVPRDPYIALWSRLRDFDPSTLEQALLDRRAVRMTLMRTTLHLVTARDAPRLRAAMQTVCERAFRSTGFSRRLDGVDLEAVCQAGVAIVEERPRTISELGRELAGTWPARDAEALGYAVRYLVPLVQVTPRGLLRGTSAARVTTLRSWLAGGDPAAAHEGLAGAPENAVDEAVERYLRAFGPATAADIRAWSWLVGARDAVERLRPRLRSYRDEAGRELVDVEDGAIGDASSPAPVRFLGEYDNVFLSHADRTRITGDLSWGSDYVRRGAFFVDGFLAGSWRLRDMHDPPTLELEAHATLSRADRGEVEAEGLALVGFLAPESSGATIKWDPSG